MSRIHMPFSSPLRRAESALLFSDDELVQAAISEILQEAGCSALKARSADEAAMLLDTSPCMAFLDLDLPGRQGDQFCEEIRASDLHWDLPIVTLTRPEGEPVKRCFLAGADDFAFKPLQKNQLLPKLEAVRKGQSSARPRQAISKSLLLATDKARFGTVFNKLLENSGYTVHRARTSTEAMGLLGSTTELHLAVIDLELGAEKLDGALLDRADAVKATMPVVAVASDKKRAVRPSWADETLFDVDTELERLVQYVNAKLLGTPSGRERRVKRRVPFHGVADFRLLGGEAWQTGGGYDLSESGMFLRALSPIEARQPVELSFELDKGSPPIQARGLVVWSNLRGPRNVFSYPCGMGISFNEIDAGHASRLSEWIASRAES